MGAQDKHARRRRKRRREADPRVVRSRAAVIEAAHALFMEKGYGGTTMDDIARRAGLTKRTLYNNYSDKEALFRLIVSDVMTFAETFARHLSAELATGITAANVRERLHDVAARLATGLVRPPVISLRRLLIGESRLFPELAKEYFERAPGQVLGVLAASFERLMRAGVVKPSPSLDARRVAAQFAYLVVGETLDRAMLTGLVPNDDEIRACARDGVEAFLGPPARRDAVSRARPRGARAGGRTARRRAFGP
jgi:TetR/AcrR family transcriptional repressor of mexJK operon